MWKIFALAVALTACTLEEPALVDEAEHALLDDTVEARVKLKTCGEHFRDCQDSKLGDIEDDVGYSRCARCLDLCDRETGCWPDKTAHGKDCDYTQEKYRRKRSEFRP